MVSEWWDMGSEVVWYGKREVGHGVCTLHSE